MTTHADRSDREVSRDRVLTIARAIVHEIRTERVTFLAGSVAYNAFLSILPLLLLVLAVVGSVGSEPLKDALVTVVQSAITPEAADVLVEELEEASLGISILGGLALVWGGLRIFRSLDTAFSDIFDSQEENTFTTQMKDSVTVFVTLVLLVLVVLFVEARITLGAGAMLDWVLQRGALFGLLCLALIPMFYLFPDERDMALVEAIPGVVVAAFGLMVLQSIFGFYLAVSGPQVSNSVLASVIILLLWLYFGALIVLCAAAVNAVLTNRSNEVNIRPVIGGTGRASPTPRSSGIPTEALERLVAELPETTTLEVTTDRGTVSLPPPDRVDADIGTSPVPFINDTAHVELHWHREGTPLVHR